MKRREFITLLGGAAAAWPLAARAQEPGRIYRLGIMITSPRASPANVAFFDELRLNGFVEGQNLIWSLAAALTIATTSLPSKRWQWSRPLPTLSWVVRCSCALSQAATRTVPLILVWTEDMVADGFVASLARPGGNITGISILSPELNGKRQDILLDAVPGARRMTVLADSNVTSPGTFQAMQDAARRRRVELSVLSVARFEGDRSRDQRREGGRRGGTEYFGVAAFLGGSELPQQSHPHRERCGGANTGHLPMAESERRATSPRMARVSSKCFASGHGSSSKCCAAPSPPISPSSSRPSLNWSSISKLRRRLVMRFRLGWCCVPTS